MGDSGSCVVLSGTSNFQFFEFFHKGGTVESEQVSRFVFNPTGFFQRFKQQLFFEFLHGFFEVEPEPQHDFDPVAVAFHEAAAEERRKILYHGTGLSTHRT